MGCEAQLERSFINMKKSLLISGAVLGALTIGSQGVNADTTDSLPVITQSDKSGLSDENGDSTLPPLSDTTTTVSSDTSSAGTVVDGGGQSGVTPAQTTPSGDQDSNSTLPDENASSSSSSSQVTPEVPSEPVTPETPAESTTPSEPVTPVDPTTPAEPASSNEQPAPDVPDQLPTNGLAPVAVPLTAETPDVNEQGQLNQVAPVQVASTNQFEAPVVPTHVATVPSVARAVQQYNDAVNTGDQEKVEKAKQDVDKAVEKALPKTGVSKSTSVSLLGAFGALSALLVGMAYKMRLRAKKIQ